MYLKSFFSLPRRPPETPETFKGYLELGQRVLFSFKEKISAWCAVLQGHPVTTKNFSEKEK